MDIGTIILVIGLVEMLKFLYKNGDLGGLNKKFPIFSPASASRRASVRDGVRRGCLLLRARCLLLRARNRNHYPNFARNFAKLQIVNTTLFRKKSRETLVRLCPKRTDECMRTCTLAAFPTLSRWMSSVHMPATLAERVVHLQLFH
jgi:hypothetical protein